MQQGRGKIADNPALKQWANVLDAILQINMYRSSKGYCPYIGIYIWPSIYYATLAGIVLSKIQFTLLELRLRTLCCLFFSYRSDD